MSLPYIYDFIVFGFPRPLFHAQERIPPDDEGFTLLDYSTISRFSRGQLVRLDRYIAITAEHEICSTEFESAGRNAGACCHAVV